jgi:hypothetical protein
MVACELIAPIEQRDHVSLIERFIAQAAEVGRNAGEVEVNPVAFRDRIDAVEVANALILDQR